MKVSEHVQLVNVDLYGDLFSKHRVHMNARGREMAAKRIVTTMKIFKYENGRAD
jgi:hypothetical protein